MLPIYRHANNVVVNVPTVDASSEPIEATSASYHVLDAAGNVVKAETTIATYHSGDASLSVTVSASENTLAMGANKDMRVVVVTLTGDPSIVFTQKYVIEADQRLVIMTNTFQTLEQAELLALDLFDLAGWGGASDLNKQVALMEAFNSLCMLSYQIHTGYTQNKLYWHNREVRRLREWTESEFMALDPLFRLALTKAQVVEADELMQKDATGMYRRKGIISYTIGETSQFLRPAKALELPVSKRSLQYLTGYVDWSIRIARG